METNDLMEYLFEGGRDFSVTTDQSLFHTGDRVQSMFLVIEGQVDLVRHSSAGSRLTLNRVFPGGMPAEASAYSTSYHCDGEARSPSRVRSISKTAFLERLHDSSKIADQWAAHLAHALQQTRTQSEIRSLKTVSERLDGWLSGNRSLPKKGQIQDLAHILGVSREALYRELAKRRQ